MHGAGKKTREINEETGVGCRTIQRTIAYGKQHGEPGSSRGNCGRGKILDERDRRSLKRPVKKNRRSSVQMITSQFNEGPKKVRTLISKYLYFLIIPYNFKMQ